MSDKPQSPAVETQHAVIEFREHESAFVLQDLNSAHGTFVNDCRILNAAVRLSPGDVLRFSHTGTSYEFLIDNQTQV